MDAYPPYFMGGLSLNPCHTSLYQFMAYGKSGKIITVEQMCVTANLLRMRIFVIPCKENDPNQLWTYDAEVCGKTVLKNQIIDKL